MSTSSNAALPKLSLKGLKAPPAPAPALEPLPAPALSVPLQASPKPSRGAVARPVRAELVARWPACFVEQGLPPRPLKVGIDRDLRAAWPKLSARRLTLGLRYYTHTIVYLHALLEGAVRVGLDGAPAGEVTAEAAAHAAAELAERGKATRGRLK